MLNKVNRHAMPEQPAEIRRRNFEEVALGYDEATAIEEAKRCLPELMNVEGDVGQLILNLYRWFK